MPNFTVKNVAIALGAAYFATQAAIGARNLIIIGSEARKEYQEQKNES